MSVGTWGINLPKLQPLGRMLLAKGSISKNELDEALETAKKNGVRLGEVLVESGYTDEGAILDIFSETLGMQVVNKLDKKVLDDLGMDYVFLGKFNQGIVDRMGIIPMRMELESAKAFSSSSVNIWKFHVVVNDPWQYQEIRRLFDDYVRKTKMDSHLRALRGSSSERSLGEFSDEGFQVEIIGYLARKNEIAATLDEITGQSGIISQDDDDSQSVLKQFRDIMNAAIARKSTDVHISPLHQRGGMWVRFRIDGELENYIRNGRITEHDYNQFLNNVMNLAGMDSTRKREPQDGGMQYPYDRTLYDLRVAIIPTALTGRVLDGSKIQIRILYKTGQIDLEDLGFFSDDLDTLRHMYSQPWGMMLCAGPTSAGKTTTVYSILRKLDLEKACCYTIEEPVEYYLEGAYQIPVSNREGRGFAVILRSLMRLDPDIVYLGEIRDGETAQIGLQVANTGHSVFSTIHTNSAYTVPLRLLSMGVPQYLLVGNLMGAVSQRLVRRNCQNCIQEYKPDIRVLQQIGLPSSGTYFRGSGHLADGSICPVCRGKGYVGRTGIHELLPLCKYTGWEKILDKPLELHAFMMEKGHLDLAGAARRKVEEGTVSPDSLFGVLARAETMIKAELG